MPLPIQESNFNKTIWKLFTKSNGLSIQKEAMEYLKVKLGGCRDIAQLEAILKHIIVQYKSNFTKIIVDKPSIVSTIEGIERVQGTDDRVYLKNYLNLLNVDQCDKWTFNPHKNSFSIQASTERKSSSTPIPDKLAIYQEHYEILLHRINKKNNLKISMIKHVKGHIDGQEKIIFGMLTQLREDSLWLEDPEDQIKLDFSAFTQGKDKSTAPLLHKGCFVIIRGRSIEDDSFQVSGVQIDPCEPRSTSFQSPTVPIVHSSQTWSTSTLACNRHLHASSAFIVTLADLWLDCTHTIQKFDQLLLGMEAMPVIPCALVLMGNFLKERSNGGADGGGNEGRDTQKLLEGLEMLAVKLSLYPKICQNTKIIIQPSLQDPLSNHRLLPRPAFPSSAIIPRFRENGIDCELASNPARLFCFDHEVVFHRRDLEYELDKARIDPFDLKESGKIAEMANQEPQICIKSQMEPNFCTSSIFRHVLDQSHLSPILDDCRRWSLDHSLRLYPAPNVLFVAEQSSPNHEMVGDCLCVQPGSFATDNFAFSIVNPLSMDVRLCHV